MGALGTHPIVRVRSEVLPDLPSCHPVFLLVSKHLQIFENIIFFSKHVLTRFSLTHYDFLDFPIILKIALRNSSI